MSNSEAVLARGAGIVATIRHSHGIKAALAVTHLQQRYPQWTEAFWHEALVRARWFEEVVVEHPVATAPFKTVTPERARVLLARSVVPYAYAAVRSWADAKGAGDIVRFYLAQAAADPEYLGHRLSILLALDEACAIYEHGAQRELYLDRLAEFIVACRFTTVSDGGAATAAATWAEACTGALTHPGFFGHHLICLAWIGRRRKALSDRLLQASLGWVAAAAATDYVEAEDNVTISPPGDADLSDASIEPVLRELLLRGQRNIHLLTLADALDWLWHELQPHARPYLVGMARHCGVADAQ